MNPSFRIDIDLQQLNNPDTPYIHIFKDQTILLFSPCGYVECPEESECDHPTASVFLCTSEKKCRALSNISTAPYFSSIYGSPEDGISVTYTSVSDTPVVFNYLCDYDQEVGSVALETVEHDQRGIAVDLYTREACLKRFEDEPVKHLKKRILYDNDFVDVDLTKLNSCNTTIIDASFSPPIPGSYSIHFNPCHPIMCPMDTCEGTENTSIWLCNKDKRSCVSYGEMDNDIFIRPESNNLMEGFVADFTAKSGKKTLFEIDCNSDLPLQTLEISFTQKIRDDILYIHGTSPEFCTASWAVPTPIPIPTKAPVPKPTKIIYQTNGTHSNILNLNHDLYFNLENSLLLSSEAEESMINLIFSPNSTVKCPLQGKCFGVDEAYSYACVEAGDGKTCIPYSLPEYGFTTLPYGEVEDGVTFTSPGLFGAQLSVYTICSSESEVSRLLMFIPPNEIVINVKSPLACPRNEIIPPYPSPVPTATPPPSDNNKIEVAFGTKKVNMKKYGQVNKEVTINIGNTNKRVMLHMNLNSPIECPPSTFCGGVVSSNAWACWASEEYEHQCLSLADTKYPIAVHNNNLTLSGGYNNYKLTMSMIGDDTVNTGMFILDAAGEEVDSHVVVRAYSTDFNVENISNTTFYVVISVIVGVGGLTLYFLIGTLVVYMTTGVCDIPHRGFWLCCFPNAKQKLPPEIRMSLLQLDSIDTQI